MAPDEQSLSPGGLPMPIPMIERRLMELHDQLSDAANGEERRKLQREIDAYEIQLKARRKVAEDERRQGTNATLEFGELPKNSKENEDEISRLQQELPKAEGERAKALRARIEALQRNRYAFTSHGGAPKTSDSSPGTDSSARQETLAEAEDRLIGEISDLQEQLSKASDPEQRDKITAAIEGRKAGLEAVQGEKATGGLSEPRVVQLQGAVSGKATLKATATIVSSSSEIGSKLNLARRASIEESALRVDDYAGALSQFIRGADGEELCFALYGHWGRGKTFLMDRVSEFLRHLGYRSVRFSAWKFPNTPELWANLHEAFAEAAYRNGPQNSDHWLS